MINNEDEEKIYKCAGQKEYVEATLQKDNGQCDSYLYYTYFCIKNSYCIFVLIVC